MTQHSTCAPRVPHSSASAPVHLLAKAECLGGSVFSQTFCSVAQILAVLSISCTSSLHLLLWWEPLLLATLLGSDSAL